MLQTQPPPWITFEDRPPFKNTEDDGAEPPVPSDNTAYTFFLVSVVSPLPPGSTVVKRTFLPLPSQGSLLYKAARLVILSVGMAKNVSFIPSGSKTSAWMKL